MYRTTWRNVKVVFCGIPHVRWLCRMEIVLLFSRKTKTTVLMERRRGMIRFPVDCPEDCPFHETFDLSVDDWTHICTKLGKQIDEYDCGFPELLPICPIEKGEEE